MILKYIPNVLTFFRLIAIVPFLLLFYKHDFVAAFYLFCLSGATDCLDGALARHFHWQSLLGSFLDPFADKLLVASSFISVALIGKLPWWLVFLVFLRDFAIFIGVLSWHCLLKQKFTPQPSLLSKINTNMQLLLIVTCLFELAFFNLATYYTQTLIILTALTTASSFINYLYIWSSKAYIIGIEK